MPEVAYAREDHCKIQSVRGGDHFFITDRSARLNHSRDSMLRCFLDPVGKREEGVGGKHGSGKRHYRLHSPNFHAVNPAHLPRADAYRLSRSSINDGIGFYVFRHFPSEN